MAKSDKTGLTGTSYFLSSVQVETLKKTIINLNPKEFHHGDCKEADAIAHRLVETKCPTTKIFIHPPLNSRARAFCHLNSINPDNVTVLPEKEYIERNHDIVDATDLLIACPLEPYEVVRSGTWATIRYARKLKRPIIYIFANGEKRFEV